jgi:hypothetical protein
MARPKKEKTQEVNTELVTEHIVNISESEITQHNDIEYKSIKEVAEEVPTQVIDTAINTPKTVPKTVLNIPEPRFTPKADSDEMDRYFRVIYNREEAERISQMITRQRDLNLWGVHQYDSNGSKNSFARSFYFRELNNAQYAVDHAQGLLV